MTPHKVCLYFYPSISSFSIVVTLYSLQVGFLLHLPLFPLVPVCATSDPPYPHPTLSAHPIAPLGAELSTALLTVDWNCVVYMPVCLGVEQGVDHLVMSGSKIRLRIDE